VKPAKYISKNEWPTFIIFLSISDGADVLSFLLVPELMLFIQALSPLSSTMLCPPWAFSSACLPFCCDAAEVGEHEADGEEK